METSLADVDSMDDVCRVTPPVMASVGEGVEEPSKVSLEDIFHSSSSSTSSSDTRGRVQEDAQLVDVQVELRSRQLRSSSSSSSSSSSVRSAPALYSAAARPRIPSKEHLYGRRSTAHVRKASSQRQRRRHHEVSSTAANDAVLKVAAGGGSGADAKHPDTYMKGAPPTWPSPVSSPPLPDLAPRYGSEPTVATAESGATPLRTSPRTTSPITSAVRHPVRRLSRFVVDVEGDPGESTDALLERMRVKEKEFDEKIHQIHHTFQHAGEQLVTRDAIIARLQEELASLRGEAASIPKAYQAREEQLLLRVETMMDDLAEEQKRAKKARRAAEEESKRLCDAFKSAEQQLAQQQHMSDDLLRQLRASDKTLHEEKLRHAAALKETREAYEAKLCEVQRTVHVLEKDLAKAQARVEDMEKDRCQHQARLLEQELSSRRQQSSVTARERTLVAERDALQEEVEAVRLSMARLLQLMSEVPMLAEYLQWNELDSEFVFLGYPTRYFATTGRTRKAESSPQRSRSRSGITVSGRKQRSPARHSRSSTTISRDDPSCDRDRTADSSGGYYHDRNLSRVSVGDTGVDDGVYAGIAAALSKNVWLNGRWAQQMMDIIAAENNFTRLKRIKLLELEEAAQLSEQLPSARDVLECRAPEHHYWIPYAVFAEAQKFKNMYYPRLPALSHFFPFLLQLNKIWRARLEDRLRVLQPLPRSPQRSPSRRCGGTHDSRVTSHSRTRDTLTEECGLSRSSSRSLGTFGLASGVGVAGAGAESPPRREQLYINWAQQEARREELQAHHHRLRREVRLHVSSPKSIQLFRLYDELVRKAYGDLGELLQLAENLHERVTIPPMLEHAERRRSSTKALSDMEELAQAQAATAEATEARDRLLCVVETVCERVGDVGDALSTRMLSNYSDLHQLIRMVHENVQELRHRNYTSHHHRTHTVAKEDDRNAGTASQGGSCSCSSSTSSAASGPSGQPLLTSELQRQLRSLLHEQYSKRALPGETAAIARESPAAVRSSTVGVAALLKLAASVLDFGEEVRAEITQATAALRTITEQALKDTARCSTD